MKPTKTEQIVLMITLLVLTAMVSFHLGSRSAAQPVTVYTAQSAPSAEETDAAGPEGPEEPSEAPEETEPAEPEKKEPTLEELAPIDLNRATEEELMLLPSIGEVRAKAIVEYREANGPFQYVEDLRNVKGIGEGILSQVMEYVTVSEGGTNG